jgi:serine/threonine protein kinase/tetratricopeptide (TPR) repeat protein
MRRVEAAGTPDQLLGRVLADKFRLTSLLGSGGTGRVYLADQINLGRTVAVKVLHRHLASDPSLIRRFHREAKSISRMSHPNVLQIIDFGEDEGLLFIAMEWIRGRDLLRVMREDWPLQPERIGRIGAQILSALEESHARHVIHRDLKPENVMLTDARGEPDFVKVCDFGLAKIAERSATAVSAITQAGVVCGTPEYMSPEQARGGTVDGRSDLYSLSVLLYQMVTGELPFTAETVMATLTKQLVDPVPRPSAKTPDMPPALEVVIMKGLAKEPEARYANAAEMRAALLTALGVSGPSLSSPHRLPTPATTPQMPARAATQSPRAAAQSPRTAAPSPRAPTPPPPALLAREPASSQQMTRAYGLPVRARRRWLMVSAVGVALALAAGIVLWPRHPPRPPLPAVAPGQRRALAILGFQNLSGQPQRGWLATALVEMLTTELSQSRRLRVVGAGEVGRMKSELHLGDAASLAREPLAQIRRNLDADLVLLGSYTLTASAPAQLRLDLRVQDSALGQTVAAVAEVGTEEQLFEVVARAGQGLREQLGGEPAADADVRLVRAALPANLDAARAYAEGLARLRGHDAVAARDLFTRAVQLDSGHAPSHLALAQAWSALGYEGRAIDESKRALELAAPLSREQRLSIEAYQYKVTNRWGKAIDAYQLLFDFFPDDLDYGLLLAEAQVRGTRAEAALTTLTRLARLPAPRGDDPRIELQRGEALATLGRNPDVVAAATKARAQARARGADLIVAAADHLDAQAQRQLGHCDQSYALADEAKTIYARTDNRRELARLAKLVGMCRGDQGDHATALRLGEEVLSICEDLGDRACTASALNGSAVALHDLGRLDEALARYQRALAIHRETNDLQHVGTTLGNIAMVRFELGDVAAARRNTEEAIELAQRTQERSYYGFAHHQLATILVALGDLEGARRATATGLAVARELGEKRPVARGLWRNATLMAHAARYDEAERLLGESTKAYRELGDDETALLNNLTLAEMALAGGKSVRAEALAREMSSSVEQNAVDPEDAARTWAVLAQVLVAERRMGPARAALDKALAIPAARLSFAERMRRLLTQVRVEAADGRAASARRRLVQVRSESRRARYRELELQARLAELELGFLKRPATRTQARLLRKEATGLGFVALASRAAALAN